MTIQTIFSQSVSLTQYVVLFACLSVRLFQLASESSVDVVARQRSDYCPRGAIFYYRQTDTLDYLSALYKFQSILKKKKIPVTSLPATPGRGS